MWPFNRNKRKFTVRFFLIGLMGNKYLLSEFTGIIDDWHIKHNGADGYAYWHGLSSKQRVKYNFYDFIIEVKEIK